MEGVSEVNMMEKGSVVWWGDLMRRGEEREINMVEMGSNEGWDYLLMRRD